MATKFEFSDDVKIEGQDIPAGTYALFTIPGEEEWTVIFNKNWQQGGTGNYKEEEDAIRFTVKPGDMPMSVETLVIDINNVTSTSSSISIIWDKSIVSFKLEVAIDERIEASIKQNLSVQPGNLYQAAVYYRQAGKDLNQALAWITEAVTKWDAQGNNVFWAYRVKAEIEAELKKYEQAIATAEISKSKAQEAGNDQYVKFNDENIAKWKEML